MKASISPLYHFDTTASIVASDLHPTSPWILTANEGGAIVLWDYTRQAALRQWHSIGLDPGYHAGLLQNVFFYDTEVLRWKWLNAGSSGDIEAFEGKKERRNWVAVLCDNKIVLLDYVTMDVTVVRQEAFEERWLTAMEIVDSNYFAVGCSDGSIRLYDIANSKVIKVFPRGAHTKAVTILRTFSQNIRQRPLLLAAGLCGAVTVWNLDTSDDMPAYRLQSAGAAISALTLSGYLMRVAVLCGDKTIMVWNLMNGQEVWRGKGVRDAKKRQMAGMTYFSHLMGSGMTLLVHTRSTHLFTLDVPQSSKSSPSLQPFLDLSPQLGDQCISDLKVHPLQPWLLVAVSTSAVTVLAYEQTAVPPGVYSDSFFTTLSPVQIQSFADKSGNPVGVETNNFLYCFNEAFLCTLTFKLSPEGVTSRQCKLSSSGKQMLQPPFHLSLSPSSLSLVLHSKSTGYYELFYLGDAPTPLSVPNRLKSGSAKDLVWHRTKDRFAVLSPVTEDGTVGSFAGKYVELVLIVYEVNREGQVFMLGREEGLGVVERVLGGSLLGVVKMDRLHLWSWETMVSTM